MTHKHSSTILLSTLLAFSLGSCKLDPVIDPNNPSIASVTNNASKTQLQSLVTGTEARSREYISTAATAFGTFGREIWYFNSSDSRNVQFWLGQGGRKPDANFYGIDRAYAAPYQTIKQANVLISAVNNTDAVTPVEKNAYIGFALTLQGYQYLIPANSQYNSGIRISVSDELNPGGFVGYQEALKTIRAVLDSGYQSLKQAGNTLPFRLTAGYSGFSTPAGLIQVNRALAARVAIYQQHWQEALDVLPASFFNIDGDLNVGPAHVFGLPPDDFNPLYYVPDGSFSNVPVVHPSMITDALPGDKRVQEKFFLRQAPLINTVGAVPLSSQYQDKRWAQNTSPIPYLRNEELVLIYAEASAQLNKTADAVKAIDRIRSVAGLPPYTGALTKDALITEILFQRRYSLWFEPSGHRWIDARRYNRLQEIPVAGDKGSVFTQLERSANEQNWDIYKGNK
ncbi:RagB/SusD family nutrient uptake outer membrane protein [Chitinophaga nivalis]|uniref:RagB/SusD family nutrient uptake outer membrane protein n=1 Tax=Chitinophaga nivalis TaxID=2991709 RepID=A0ABT3IGU1_9BACT|nr:RagB/SusD family nutrient uptake outer membrane protein [Chitinophaga nivalis]MCW3467143.1 RagB/SusD family nutrient uptake outer membrane protein [Chitinophaga nivalis]MCW3483166.1 RagB/SusD family nutrient uptake outer membrane protein [Chitinophaga nivalis]